MRTTNFQIDLMIPDQINKDVIFNESMLSIDHFLCPGINGFIDKIPDKIKVGEKYIITTGKHANHICYYLHQLKQIKFLPPKKGMILFSLPDKYFLFYDGNLWQKFIGSNSSGGKKAVNFTPIKKNYTLPSDKKHLYLYLDGDTKLNLTKITDNETTIIIKQHYKNKFTLKWPDNILWPQKKAHQITQIPNSTDIIKLIKLVESKHFIGQIIGQNYQF